MPRKLQSSIQPIEPPWVKERGGEGDAYSVVIDVGTTGVGIRMGGNHDGKQHQGGGEATGGCDTGRRGGDEGIRSHCCLRHQGGGEAMRGYVTGEEERRQEDQEPLLRRGRRPQRETWQSQIRRKSVVWPGQA
jgi:hypothetical protein